MGASAVEVVRVGRVADAALDVPANRRLVPRDAALVQGRGQDLVAAGR